WLPWAFEACLLKGRSNYLSLRRWRRYLAEPCREADELRFKLKILVWLNQTSTGDRSELRLQGSDEVFWARIASDPLDCVGVRCTSEDCYVHRAREEAESADLIVVNHALLLADAVQGGAILPHYEHLVVDEAHHMEEAATQGLRQEVDGPGLLALLERLAGSGGERGLIEQLVAEPDLFTADVGLEEAAGLAVAARSRAEELFEAAWDWVRSTIGERDESVRLTPAVKKGPQWERLRERGEDGLTALAALEVKLRRAVAAGREWLPGDEPDQGLRELDVIRGRLQEAAGLVREAVAEPDPNRVTWFQVLARAPALTLRSVPLDVGGLLREHVFEGRGSVVLTSASLAVGGTFDYFLSRVGLSGRDVETLILASPFDYLRQALVCLPSGLPEPQSPEFAGALAEVVSDVVSKIEGRTLALFTSHRQLRETCWALKQRRDLDSILILAQGVDGPRRQVLRAFAESERALLLGTASFWEGIDLPGDQLSCVVMARLPFPVPSDPVFAARAEMVRDPFRNYALPLAALRLKQGFGRLIRRGTDRGAVVILDARISSRDYGRAFLEVLPPASRFQGPAGEVGARVREWLGMPELRSGSPAGA
ncbi:MAG: ATP-dependent DNA helicase, partial [Candidatus Dormibacterales bacterium]